jgi:hypothetical protein
LGTVARTLSREGDGGVGLMAMDMPSLALEEGTMRVRGTASAAAAGKAIR